MTTVPVVGLWALVWGMVGEEGPGLPSVGVVMDATPVAGTVPPPGSFPTAVTL